MWSNHKTNLFPRPKFLFGTIISPAIGYFAAEKSLMVVAVYEADINLKSFGAKESLEFREPTLGRHLISMWNGKLPDILKGIKNDISIVLSGT